MNQISNLCRLCSKSSNIRHDVLKNSILINSRVVSLEEILYSTMGIKTFEEDQLSTLICDECTNQITNFYVFKRKVEETEAQYLPDQESQENENLTEKETEALNDLLEKVTKFVIKYKVYRLDIIETNRKLEVIKTRTFNCPNCSSRFLTSSDFEEHFAVCENFLRTAVSDHINEKYEDPETEDCIYEDYLELDDYEEKEEIIEEVETKPGNDEILVPNQFIIIDQIDHDRDLLIKKEEIQESSSTPPHNIEMKKISRNSTNERFSYSCPNCDKSFQSQSGLNSHLRLSCTEGVDERTDEQRLIYTCKNCFLVSSTASQHLKHISKCTGKNQDLKLQKLVLYCPTENCKSEFEDLRLLRQHALTCCPTSIVARKFTRGKYNTKKSDLPSNNSKKTSSCSFCNKRFDDDFMRENHYEIHKAFNFLYAKNHLKFHDCEKCHMTFSTSKDLEEHSEKFTCNVGSSSVKCGTCNTSFSIQDIKTLKEHIFFRHLNNFVCPVESCKVDLKTPRFFYFHIQMRHPNFLEIATEFKCQYCGKAFENYPVLSLHRKKECNAKKFNCQHCDKVYGSRALLNAHVFKINNPFICTVCKKSCKDSSQLKIHMRTHTKERPYKCNICNVTFTTPGLRAAHADKHNLKKNFKCKLCSKEFQTKMNLTSHMKNHTGNMYCTVCGNLYASQKSLECHMRSHKNKTNKKSEINNC